MKKSYKYAVNGKTKEVEYNYIPVRYIIAALITLIEIALVIGVVILCCIYVPYFYVAALITQIACVIRIIASEDNPDYKVPWLIIVLVVPVAGFMLYFMFYSRTLHPKFRRRIIDVYSKLQKTDDTEVFESLREHDALVASEARMLADISRSGLYRADSCQYYPIGEELFKAMLDDLKSAESFILMEYFIIEEGQVWGAMLDILKRKAAEGVDVRVVYDDVGCMMTLPGDYAKTLGSFGIKATPFSRLRGNADSEFNNRSHRKICIIDGRVGYTGGVNLADEYANIVTKFGHWKDVGIRITGRAVNELTSLFLGDYFINVKEVDESFERYYNSEKTSHGSGFILPFGDGPRPVYERNVAKTVIQSMLATAHEYVYIMTPYLIIDNELCTTIENAALRGVDVRLVLPHIPDKRLIFTMTKSYYSRLIKAGVRIFEYEPGFVHAKVYLADGERAIVGTVNLDYRSLVHHFENGVWLYRADCISDIRADFDTTLDRCIEITADKLKTGLGTRFLRAVIKIFAPML